MYQIVACGHPVVTSGQPPGSVVRALIRWSTGERHVTPQVRSRENKMKRGRSSAELMDILRVSERSVMLTFKDKPGKLIN